MRYYNPLSIISSIIGFFILLYFFLPLLIFIILGSAIYIGIMTLLGKGSLSFKVMKTHYPDESFSGQPQRKPLAGEIIETTLKKD